MNRPTLLLTGATGFVGRHAAIALAAAGYQVRGLCRDLTRARSVAPELEWVVGDLESPSGIDGAFAEVSTAVYLYHAVGTRRDYAEREARVARAFAAAADRSGVSRIVYVGGVVPERERSRHLESRRITGEILRGGRATCLELRASMIIGHGSASFGLVRDLAVRLPILALPPWLDNESCPVSICDVAAAVALACRMETSESNCFELPGPERLSHRRLIELLTTRMGTRLLSLRLAALPPTLAALGLGAISDVDAALSRELVAGLDGDLLPSGDSFWRRIGDPPLRPLRSAIVDALSDEASGASPGPETRRRIARKVIEWLGRVGPADDE